MIRERGEILVIVIAALGVVLFSVLFIIAGAQIYFQSSTYSYESEKATMLAEAGVDKAITSLNKTGGSYGGESETVLGDGSYSVTITSTDAATKVIESKGYVPSKLNARAKRTLKITSSRGVGASFVYGVQVGEGGLDMGNSNVVTGSIYSNGSITGKEGNEVTGDVWVAGGPQATADQSTDCDSSNCTDLIFGTQVSGQSQLDVAQSFKPTISTVLNRINLKVKKIGNPGNIKVRILKDKSGEPDKNQVLATGDLVSSLVSVNYGWIEVAFDVLPSLTAGTVYWIMVDTSSSTSDYWAWQADLAKSYTCGNPDECIAKWSPNWSAGNPSWTMINADLSFRTFMGGAPTKIDGGTGKAITVKKDAQGKGGDVHANTIRNITIQGAAYFQILENSTAASYNPGSPDPPPKVFPISDANVTDWENQAQIAGVTTGDITSCPSVLGPGKIVGSVTFGTNCNVTIKSPVWIAKDAQGNGGNLTFNSNNILRLDSSWGETSGVIVVDGQITMGTNNKLLGTGQGSSILMALSKYDSRTNGISAITITNTDNSGVFYASKGIIEPGNRNAFKELTAWGIKLINNGTINYETGLSSTIFQSGPSGTYTLVKGTYQVK